MHFFSAFHSFLNTGKDKGNLVLYTGDAATTDSAFSLVSILLARLIATFPAAELCCQLYCAVVEACV